jgi:hypothetical protein
MATWKFPPTSTPEGRARAAGLFGKLTFRYTESVVYGTFDNQQWETPYWVIESGKNFVLTGSQEEGAVVQHRIFLEGSQWIFWLTHGGNVEYFRRVEA